MASDRWGLRTAYFRRFLAMANRVICPSRFVASYFEGFGATPARLRVIPNGVSVETRCASDARSTPRSRGRVNLAYLGSVVPHKGVDVIISALEQARLGPVELRILGRLSDRPDYVAKLEEQAALVPDLELRCHGGYRPADLPTLLEDVDCVITPSIVPESFSVTTREAFVLGIPAIVARVGALPEAIREGENGFSFAPRQPSELAAILQRLAGDEALLDRLREGARATSVVGPLEHAAMVRAVYQEAIADLAGRPSPCSGDVQEMGYLHAALLEHHFGPLR